MSKILITIGREKYVYHGDDPVVVRLNHKLLRQLNKFNSVLAKYDSGQMGLVENGRMESIRNDPEYRKIDKRAIVIEWAIVRRIMKHKLPIKIAIQIR